MTSQSKASDDVPLTAEQLIEELQALTPEERKLPVYAGYDGFCHTAIYGASIAKGFAGEAFIHLHGD